MATRRMQKLSAVWMLLAVLCLLLITPFRNITALHVSCEVDAAMERASAEDSLTARIEAGKLSDMAELRHFLNATIEKNGSRTRMAQRFDEGSEELLHRGVTIKPDELYLLLGIPGHGVSLSSLSILTILDSIRLLN